MKNFIKLNLVLGLVILTQVGCVSMALNALKKVPTQEEIAAMKVGETQIDDVKKKWPDFNTTLVNEKVCLTYFKPNAAASMGVVGGSTEQSILCFKDNVLVDRTSSKN